MTQKLAMTKQSLLEQVEHLRKISPDFYATLDMKKVLEVSSSSALEIMTSRSPDFDSITEGGRGESYRYAQQNPQIRAIGIRQIFALSSPAHSIENLSPTYKILDVLGGDGTLARALPYVVSQALLPQILTSDLAKDMVIAAQTYGLPSIQQPAQNLLLKDRSVDAVLLAYGVASYSSGSKTTGLSRSVKSPKVWGSHCASRLRE